MEGEGVTDQVMEDYGVWVRWYMSPVYEVLGYSNCYRVHHVYARPRRSRRVEGVSSVVASRFMIFSRSGVAEAR